jgi:putative Holliday junction resolvase
VSGASRFAVLGGAMSSRLVTLEALADVLPRQARLLGVDLGTKTIGLALSDVERRIATPLTTIARTKFTKDAEKLIDEIKRFEVFALVVGLPLNMDGGEGPRAQATRAFLRNLAPLCVRPVALWDERLSTAAVNRSLIAQDVSRAKRAAVVDRMAAAYILQGALDRLNDIVSTGAPTTNDQADH